MSVLAVRAAADQGSLADRVFGSFRESIRLRLMARAVGAGNDAAFAAMIASRATGLGALPPCLGLEPAAYGCLLDHHFPGARSLTGGWWCGTGSGNGVPLGARGAAWFPRLSGTPRSGPARVDPRQDERADLMHLLLMHKAGDSPSEVWMAHVVAAGCMGSDHLWQDLGLSDRTQLSALMRRNFPSLAARNVKDMKWKRFLYKQLCETEGVNACRAPSCEVCTDYHVCFGPEH